MDEAKIKALEGMMAQIEKQYGKGAIMRLGQQAGFQWCTPRRSLKNHR